MKKRLLGVLLLSSLIGLAGCSDQQNATASVDKQVASPPVSPSVQRWYNQEQVARGNVLFQTNCASCHKSDASGTPHWKEPDAEGKYPPPPLNGTAHTWHHPLSVLHRTVQRGGIPLGGTMPGFADKLNNQQIDDILAWVQTHWSDEIYRVWYERNAQASKSMRPINGG